MCGGTLLISQEHHDSINHFYPSTFDAGKVRAPPAFFFHRPRALKGMGEQGEGAHTGDEGRQRERNHLLKAHVVMR